MDFMSQLIAFPVWGWVFLATALSTTISIWVAFED
jgi:hypothetical protein